MKIAIDSGPLSGGDSIRGIGVYVRELTRNLKNVNVVDTSKIKLDEYDLIHFTRFNPFRLSVPFIKPAKTKYVLTIYDLIPLIYPSNYPPGVKGRIIWNLNKYLIRKNIDAVITISETSKKDICRFTGISPQKVFVTYLAAPGDFKKLKRGLWEKSIENQYKLPDRFALYVGDINYNKNIPNLVKASEKSGIKLVIAGKQVSNIDEMDLTHPELKHLRSVSWKNVIRLGFVPDHDLVKIYNLADVYVQPSFYEGFSLPPLQAIKCGTPVALSKNQCHIEVFGENCKFFNPNDINSIVEALKNPNVSIELPRNYDWAVTSQKTSDAYQKA